MMRIKSYAFTLIEVLASMAVLAVLMLALLRIFSESSEAFKASTVSVARNAGLRVALERIVKDIEGMAVDRQLAMYKGSNVMDPSTVKGVSKGTNEFGFGFDELFIVSSEGDADDGREYELIWYHVVINTNVTDAIRFQLRRDTCRFDAASARSVDPFGGHTATEYGERRWWEDSWWKKDDGSPGAKHLGFYEQVLLENMVRFDIYLSEMATNNIQTCPAQDFCYFDSVEGIYESGWQFPSNTPPPYIDVYLQATSDDVAQRGGMGLTQSPLTEVHKKARTLLIRESAMLFTRASPFRLSGEWNHPR